MSGGPRTAEAMRGPSRSHEPGTVIPAKTGIQEVTSFLDRCPVMNIFGAGAHPAALTIETSERDSLVEKREAATPGFDADTVCFSRGRVVLSTAAMSMGLPANNASAHETLIIKMRGRVRACLSRRSDRAASQRCVGQGTVQ